MPSFMFGNDSQDQANAMAEAQAQIARQQWKEYKKTYLPFEREFVKESRNWDSPERYARAAGDASATVAEQFGKARERLQRQPGLDPSNGAYQASMVGLDLAQAANDATQQNAARANLDNTAMQVKTNALGLGKSLPAQALQGYQGAAGTYGQMAGLKDSQNNRLAGSIGSTIGTGLGIAAMAGLL